jgi:hypothetical protein
MKYNKYFKIAGFHGTSNQSADEIINSNYKITPNPEDWLGSGVYFFINGISCPIKNANDWARKKFGDDSSAVLKSYIVASHDSVLNLTTAAGLSTYDKFRIKFLEQNKIALADRRDLNIKKRKDIRLDDRIVTEALLTELSISVLIHNVYIKNELQRNLAMESSYPNATVCSVRDLSLIKRAKKI